jgi:hypothetical protein
MKAKPNRPDLAGKLFYMDAEVSASEAVFANKSLVGYCRDCGKRLTSRNAVPYPDPGSHDPTPVVLCPQCYDERLP